MIGRKGRGLSAFVAAILSIFAGGPSTGADAATAAAFHKAVHRGDVAAVRAMLEKDGALATSLDEFRFQPIHLLDMYFEAAILDLLLERGADINARNDEGVTILHIVTDPDAVPVLIAKGADREARDRRGWTPLVMQANEREREDVIEALLRAGADPTAKGNEGETALSFARERSDESVMRLLERAGAAR